MAESIYSEIHPNDLGREIRDDDWVSADWKQIYAKLGINYISY